jgi:ferrochelatase
VSAVTAPVDAVLLIAFGGPTRMEEVRPFLENVLRGRPVPPERIEAVVHHYELIGGCSPLNELTMRQARGLETELRRSGSALPVYVGMRNWTPYLAQTLARMAADGMGHAVGVIMAAQQNDAGWGRYMRDVTEACAQVGRGAPQISFASEWHAHPSFIAAMADQVRSTLERIPASRRLAARLVFTAHSIPVALASESPYVAQVQEAARLVAESVGFSHSAVAYQSRSGSPREPWLEPDICDVVRTLVQDGVSDVVVVPIGFVCDHVEVLYDLDIEAKQVADSLGLGFWRVSTANDHPEFIRMLADVVQRTIATLADPPYS